METCNRRERILGEGSISPPATRNRTYTDSSVGSFSSYLLVSNEPTAVAHPSRATAPRDVARVSSSESETLPSLPSAPDLSAAEEEEEDKKKEDDLEAELREARLDASEARAALRDLAEGVRILSRQLKRLNCGWVPPPPPPPTPSGDAAPSGDAFDVAHGLVEGERGSGGGLGCDDDLDLRGNPEDVASRIEADFASRAEKLSGIGGTWAGGSGECRDRTWSNMSGVSAASSSILSYVSDDERRLSDLSSSLVGTVGADLLGLSNACRMVGENSRLASEEAASLAEDATAARSAAESAEERAAKAEALAKRLYKENKALKRDLEKARKERRLLAKEVRAQLSERAALERAETLTKKEELLRGLEEHVRGALQVHERQLARADNSVSIGPVPVAQASDDVDEEGDDDKENAKGNVATEPDTKDKRGEMEQVTKDGADAKSTKVEKESASQRGEKTKSDSDGTDEKLTEVEKESASQRAEKTKSDSGSADAKLSKVEKESASQRGGKAKTDSSSADAKSTVPNDENTNRTNSAPSAVGAPKDPRKNEEKSERPKPKEHRLGFGGASHGIGFGGFGVAFGGGGRAPAPAASTPHETTATHSFMNRMSSIAHALSPPAPLKDRHKGGGDHGRKEEETVEKADAAAAVEGRPPPSASANAPPALASATMTHYKPLHFRPGAARRREDDGTPSTPRSPARVTATTAAAAPASPVSTKHDGELGAKMKNFFSGSDIYKHKKPPTEPSPSLLNLNDSEEEGETAAVLPPVPPPPPSAEKDERESPDDDVNDAIEEKGTSASRSDSGPDAVLVARRCERPPLVEGGTPRAANADRDDGGARRTVHIFRSLAVPRSLPPEEIRATSSFPSPWSSLGAKKGPSPTGRDCLSGDKTKLGLPCLSSMAVGDDASRLKCARQSREGADGKFEPKPEVSRSSSCPPYPRR